MKKIKLIFLLFIILAADSAFSQSTPTISKEKDEKLTQLLNNLSLISENKSGNLSIHIFKIEKGSGSINNSGSDESTSTLYIAISELDELPQQNLFNYGPLYNPKVIGYSGDRANQNIIIESGFFSSRKQETLKVSIDRIEVVR